MVFAAGAVFALSLLGVIALFVLKRAEVRSGYTHAPRARARADDFALFVKYQLQVTEWYIAHTPAFIALLARIGVRAGALGFARFARVAEREAHRLADFVSHKRNFERRETKSEYLKQVGEHKNGKREEAESSESNVGQL